VNIITDTPWQAACGSGGGCSGGCGGGDGEGSINPQIDNLHTLATQLDNIPQYSNLSNASEWLRVFPIAISWRTLA
jgi:hypothetical protein